MATSTYPTARGFAEKYIPGGQLVDLSTASISYAPIPSQGIITDAFCTISAAITTADSVVTVKAIKSGATVTIGTITVAYTGSAAGSTFSIVLSGTEAARSVKRGDTIVFDNGGQSDTTSIANFLAVIRET
jgi:hypothetical protein